MNQPETILERYSQAVKDLDKTALLALYSSDLRMFDMMAPFEFSGRSEFAHRVDEWFDEGGQDQSVTATRIESKVGVDLAVMTMFMRYAFSNDDSDRHELITRLTWVLVPEGEDWKILHEHSSVPLSDQHDGTRQLEP